jgi:hypothetical protein
MLYTILLSLALGGIALVGCAPVSVQWDYDAEADFSRYRTFDWMPPPPTGDGSPSSRPFWGKRIKRAVLESLTADGYSRDTQKPDLLVAYRIYIKEKQDIQVYGHPYGYGQSYGYWGRRPADVRRWREGTLVLDLVDTGTGELVWRGWSRNPLESRNDPRREQESVSQVVAQILKRFPPDQRQRQEPEAE